MLNGLDLFSGIGGITIALGEFVRPIAYCENDSYAQAVLLSRQRSGELPIAPIWDDVRTLNKELLSDDVDIIYGGFPCQDISNAGPRKGIGGKRSGLFYEIVRLSKEIEPEFIFLENVPGIRTRGLDRVVWEFSELGYDCRWDTLSAEEVGACHKRNRWFFLAHSLRKRRRIQSRGWERKSWEETPGATIASKDMANPTCHRGGKGWTWKNVWGRLPNPKQASKTNWPKEIPEPSICGMANGIPHRVDKLRALGNAVVPMQAREAFMRLTGLQRA